MKRILLAAAAVTFGVALALGVLEIGLRAMGYGPWLSFPTPGIEPTLNDPDPEIGWVLKPGHWRYGPYVPQGTPIEVTIAADRSRRTRPERSQPGPAHPQVLVLGCSFTFGWGVSDDETWPWALQELRPDLDVRNRATGAYGTLQAWQLLRRVLASGERPARVIYGFIPEHEVRNVGDPNWLRALSMFTGANSQNILVVPYCELDDHQQLLCHEPRRYPEWPLRDYSAAITFLQDAWFAFRSRARAASGEEVTRQLIAEMDRLCREHGIPFSLLLLKVGAERRDAFVPFALQHGIDVIDCDRPLRHGDHVPGDLHPNAGVHRAWAKCVAAALADPARRAAS